MLKFERGRSYLWLFPVFCVLFVGGFALSEVVFGTFVWGSITLPIFVAGMLICQLRSDYALDGWWHANYPKGSWQYRFVFATQTLALIYCSWFSYQMIQLR